MLQGIAPEIAVSILAATAILIAGVVDDLKTRKFHNWLFLTVSGFALIVLFLTRGVSGLPEGALGFAAGIAIMLPLVLMKIIGAGDMKLTAAFGILAGSGAVLSVAIFSLVWGVVFGLARAAFAGQLGLIANNLATLALTKGKQPIQAHRIPYTVAILMGWLTHLVYQGVL
jgi:prepilin peptidase CpaA